MKRLSIFLTALMACTLSFAAEKTWTWTASSKSDLGTSKSVEVTLNEQKWKVTRSDVYTTNLTSGYIQLGKNGGAEGVALTSSAFKNYTVKSVSIDCASYQGKHSVTIMVGEDAFLKSQPTTIWNGKTGGIAKGVGVAMGDVVISFTVNSGARALYIKSISITYDDKVVSVEKPTIAVAAGSIVDKDGFYDNNLQLTMACATDGATIHYTLDGTEPTVASPQYSSALSFTNEFVTINAKAFKGEEESFTTSANYYHKSSIAYPYTTTQALKLYSDNGVAADIYVAGSVTNITSSVGSGNANYTITDGTSNLYIYRGETDATSGLTDITTMMEGDQVVVLGTIATYKEAPQIQEKSKIVKWIENLNPILTCNSEVIDFGSISMYADAPQKTLVITTKNITEDLTVTLSGEGFFIDKTTLPAAGGTIMVTTDMEALGENAATLIIAAGEKNIQISLNSEILLANLISWSVNGTVVSSVDVLDGEAVVLPAEPEVPRECSGKTFMGWATTAIVNADGTGITWVNDKTVPTANATYYAVFALVTESEELTTATIDFSKQGYTNKKELDGVTIAIDDVVSVVFNKAESSNSPTYYTTGEAIRLYAKGTCTISSMVTMTNIEITFGKDDGKNELSSDIETWNGENTWTGSSDKVVITVQGDNGHRRFQKISVTHKTMKASEYTTKCDAVGTDLLGASVNQAQQYNKMIVNGQLIIVRNGVQYNAQGQVVK